MVPSQFCASASCAPLNMMRTRLNRIVWKSEHVIVSALQSGKLMRRLALLLSMSLGLSLTAFGGRAVTSHSESANQFVKTAAKALASAKSVRLSGTIRVSGGSETLDLVLFSNGDFEGSLTLQGYPVHLIVLDATDYYKAPAAWWRKALGLSTTTAKEIAPYWVKAPKSAFAAIGNSFKIAALASSLRATSGLTIVGHEKIEGQSAVGVKSSQGGVLWIATSGAQYPISEVKAGSGGGSLTFSGWDSFALPTAPKGALSP